MFFIQGNKQELLFVKMAEKHTGLADAFTINVLLYIIDNSLNFSYPYL